MSADQKITFGLWALLGWLFVLRWLGLTNPSTWELAFPSAMVIGLQVYLLLGGTIRRKK